MDLTDAISSASANGHVDMMHRLVREIGERAANDGDDSDGFSDDSDESSDSYESSYDSDDSSETDNGRISSSEDSDDDSVFDIFSDDLLDMMQQLLQPIGEDSDSDDGDFSSESDDFSDDSDEDSEDDDVEERMSKPVERYRMQCKQQRSMGNLLWCLCSSRRLSVQATMEKHVVICTTPRGKSSMKQPHMDISTWFNLR